LKKIAKLAFAAATPLDFDMKPVLTFCVFLCSTMANSQITIANYPKQFSCEVDAISEIQVPEASSACGEVKMTFDDQVFSGGCLGTLVRTYKYTDACKNEEKAEQYISLTDKMEPILYGVPKNITIGKNDTPPPAAQLSSRDNSGQNFEVTMTETILKNQIRREWSCTDACGNTAKAMQIITIE
jgi:hypothetical protein